MCGHTLNLKLKTTSEGTSKTDFSRLTDDRKEMILAVIADPYCRDILHATKLIPKSAVEINSDTHVPISTVYRRIGLLCDAGLLKTTGSISKDGKKFFMYKSLFKKIDIKFDGSLQITTVPNR